MSIDEGICLAPARELAHRLQKGEIGTVELLEAHFARIDALDPAIGAVVSIDREGAHRQAVQADAELHLGTIRGPLHGVPMTLKDGHDVAGLRTTVGAAALDRIAEEDGTVAARLRAAGAILFGHTNVPAFLDDHQTENTLFGRTSNPWDSARTVGGSSGGAAAALAAGLTPLEVGSDLFASTRLPAHFCGVYGLKTTEHRVPMSGFLLRPGGPPRSLRIMTGLGPMARDLGDLELALSIIAGPDGADTDVPPVALGGDSRPLGALRLAVAPTLPGAVIAKALRASVKSIAARAADAGAQVEERLPPIDWAAQGALFGELLGALIGVVDPAMPLRDEQRTLAWYFAALERRDHFIACWESFFGGFDALLLPAGMTAAFPHHPKGASFVVEGQTADYWGHGSFHGFANLAGLPSLVAPAGLVDGLPIGIQIVGPRWSEMRLIDIARHLETAQILPGFQRPPGI